MDDLSGQHSRGPESKMMSSFRRMRQVSALDVDVLDHSCVESAYSGSRESGPGQYY